MNNFGKNLKAIRQSKSLKQADLEDLVGIKQTTWNNYELGKSFPKFQDLMIISKKFGISETDLIHSNLSDILPPNLPPILPPKVEKVGKLIDKADKNIPKAVLKLAEENAKKTIPKTIPNTTPNSLNEGRQNIILVEHKVAAGFAQIVNNERALEELPRFTTPQLMHKMGTYLCFPVSGDSMHPTVKDKEWVIVEQKEGIVDIKGGRVYMLCTHEGLVLKRLYYKQGEKTIKCVSDNETYAPYKEDVANVLGIYEACIHFSDDFRNWNSDVRSQLNTVSDSVISAIERITTLEAHVFKKK